MARASLAKKVAAVAAADLVGSTHRAGELLGVSPRRIRAWRAEGKKDPEIARMVEEALSEAKSELVVAVSDMLPSLVGFIGRKVQRLIEDDAEITPRDLQSLSVTAGIWVDKLVLWDKAMPPPMEEGSGRPLPDLSLLDLARKRPHGEGEEGQKTA